MVKVKVLKFGLYNLTLLTGLFLKALSLKKLSIILERELKPIEGEIIKRLEGRGVIITRLK